MSTAAAISVDPKADWLSSADLAIVGLCTRYRRTGQTFTADDVHEIAGQPDDPHWAGSAFQAARTRGEIVKTHAYVPSKRRGRKGSMIAVWRAAT